MIRYVQAQPIRISNHDKTATPPGSAGKEIVSNFERMFDRVNREQLAADKKISEMVAGRNKDIPKTMLSMEKADVSLRLLMAVRNKLVSAYEEIMRMQV